MLGFITKLFGGNKSEKDVADAKPIVAAINQEYEKDFIIVILRTLISIIEKTSGKRNKSIISFVMFDFILKNINFLHLFTIQTPFLFVK